jgi:hypothetical protein
MHTHSHFRSFFKSFLLVTVIWVSSISAAFAEDNDIFERFRKPMPEIPLIDKEEFYAQTRPIKDVPYNQKALGYTMRLPKDWVDTGSQSSKNFILSEKLFLDLNGFYGPASPFGRSRIEIQALSMESNLTMEQWYLKYILEAGMTPEGFLTHNPDKVESLMVIMEGDYSYYLRTLITRNENKIIMFKYYVPVGFMQQEASMQASVVNSFEVLTPLPKKEMSYEMYRFLDVAEIKYPTGWRVYSKPMRSVDYLDAAFVNMKGAQAGSTGGSSNGKLDVSLVLISDGVPLMDEVMKYKKKIELSGVLIGEKYVGYGDFKHNEEMDFGISEVYKGVDSLNNQSEYEFWFSVLVGGNYYYFMMLLTPSRNENFSVWADNVQNYHFMLKNIKPMSGAYLERQ